MSFARGWGDKVGKVGGGGAGGSVRWKGGKKSPWIIRKLLKMVDVYLFIWDLSFVIGVVRANEPNLLK